MSKPITKDLCDAKMEALEWKMKALLATNVFTAAVTVISLIRLLGLR